MRKYYQAALAITAAVSLVSLLFYRHEYNKLRYVLEVFNYFGKPKQKTIETNCTNNAPILTKFNTKFEEPLSSWQRLENDLYVYSAYNIHEKEVQVIGYGSLDSIEDMQCIIFFENEIEPVLGSFKYTLINSDLNIENTDKNLNHNGYHFHCTYTLNKIPVGIAFLTKSDTDVNNTPILSIKNASNNKNYSNIGVCISPPLMKPMQSSEIISFINFHDLIGVDNFLVYDFGIPIELNNNLKQLSQSSNPYWKFIYTVIPWNFPFPGTDPTVIKNLIQADCLYRMHNKVMYVVTMSWEEYIILKYHHSLVDLMVDFKRFRMKADRYKLKTSTFCTQQEDDPIIKNSTLTIFKKTHFDPNIVDDQPVYIYNTHEALKKSNIYTQEIGKDLVSLNRYKHCFGQLNPNTDNKDTSISRFAKDIENSPMFRKFIIENGSRNSDNE